MNPTSTRSPNCFTVSSLGKTPGIRFYPDTEDTRRSCPSGLIVDQEHEHRPELAQDLILSCRATLSAVWTSTRNMLAQKTLPQQDPGTVAHFLEEDDQRSLVATFFKTPGIAGFEDIASRVEKSPDAAVVWGAEAIFYRGCVWYLNAGSGLRSVPWEDLRSILGDLAEKRRRADLHRASLADEAHHSVLEIGH